MMAIRLRFVSLLLVVQMMVGVVAVAESVEQLPLIRDFRVEAELAKRKQLPMLVLFSTDYCDVCTFIKANYLLPMQRNDDYDNKVIVRELPVTDYHTLKDFNGDRVAGDRVALRYNVDLIPSIVLMDHTGRALAPTLVGITSQAYFDQQLDEHINLALQRLAASQ